MLIPALTTRCGHVSFVFHESFHAKFVDDLLAHIRQKSAEKYRAVSTVITRTNFELMQQKLLLLLLLLLCLGQIRNTACLTSLLLF